MSKNGAEASTKKKLKGWQIGLIAAACVLVVVLIAVGGVLIWLFTGSSVASGVDPSIIGVNMNGTLYAGSEGEINWKVGYPDKEVKVNGSAVETSAALKNGDKVSIGGVEYTVSLVDGAVNVNSVDQLYNAINSDKNKKPVVVLADKLVLRNETLQVRNHFYGNGVKINAHAVIGRADELKSEADKKAAAWATAIQITKDEDWQVKEGEKLIFQDTQVYGDEYDPVTDDDVSAYFYYGSTIAIGDQYTDERTPVILKHNIFEKGGKVVHVIKADLIIEDTVIRDAADTTLSIGGFKNAGSQITLKGQVVIASSYTAGIVMYCYESGYSEADLKSAANNITVDTKDLRLYTWKNHKGLSFIPPTESAAISQMGNKIAGSEFPRSVYDNLKGIIGENKYVHFGIVKMRNAGNKTDKNYSTVDFKYDIGYKQASDGFPIPDIAYLIINHIDIWSYLDNMKNLHPTAKLADDNVFKSKTPLFTYTAVERPEQTEKAA